VRIGGRLRAVAAVAVAGVVAGGGVGGWAEEAWAGDPIMPLSQVHAGMSCTGYTVVQGSTISSFNVQVVDVVNAASGQTVNGGPAILTRISGPAVDASGMASGMSGSPVYCPDSQGVQRNIGALAATIGQYGNQLVLATPIESVLGEPVIPPAGTRPTAAVSKARPSAEPLVIGGVSAPVASLFRTIAARAGRALYVAPGSPGPAFPVQTLRPGASVAAAWSSGDISASAIGTVSYTDGSNVWAFGHPLDSAGRRSLLLEDAYVYSVVNNPLPASDTNVGSYKLAVADHDLGTLSNDGLSAVVGTVGALPPRFPLQVVARNTDSGQSLTQNSLIADESGIGLPAGVSALSLVGPIAVDQAASQVLRGAPPQQSGSMCVQIHVQEAKEPLGFCNNYVIDGTIQPSTGGGLLEPDNSMMPYLDDINTALGDVDAFKLGVLHITGVNVTMSLAQGVHEGYMVGARPPAHRVRRGSVARVLVDVQMVRGPRFERVIPVPVPRGIRPGRHLVKLSGTPADSSGAAALASLVAVLGGGGGSGSGSTSTSDAGPASVADLAGQIASIHHFDGVTARFLRRGASAATAAAVPAQKSPNQPGSGGSVTGGGGGQSRGARGTPIYSDPKLRLSGTASVPLNVR